MEGLRKLGQVQKLLELMQSQGIINSSSNTTNADSERFLANLFLLMIQPCGELDMNTKCQLVSEHLPKISAAFLEEALQCLSEEGHEPAETVFPLYCDKKAGLDSLQNDSDSMGMVGLDAMQRANSTLEDFCRSYFMFHEMDVNQPQSIFRYLPILSFTEGYIYQLDSLNEKSLQLPISGVPDSELGLEANQSWIVQFMKLFGTEPFRPHLVLLEQHGLLTGRIREEFRFGEEYWALERKLCSALMSKQEVSVEDVMRAIHLKSFDYRVLNLLLYQLRGEEVNELHMEFLSVSEFLVEISDDLFDYEEDVLENNFNILRMLVRIYGASTAPTMLARLISEAEEKYDLLLKSLDPKLSMNYQKRCEEATKEGGKITGPSFGTWSIPPVIEDEDSYRSKISNSKQSVVSGDTFLTLQVSD
ncbi:unnamed protein product [Ilex paraguariensis]|uniref:Uncharacterized protein n=1 Tax=Ilex paraguariensis TaxID=185542 RepID=A0ABC8TN35_9AQUA